jgi:hypothetical protein
VGNGPAFLRFEQTSRSFSARSARLFRFDCSNIFESCGFRQLRNRPQPAFASADDAAVTYSFNECYGSGRAARARALGKEGR